MSRMTFTLCAAAGAITLATGSAADTKSVRPAKTAAPPPAAPMSLPSVSATVAAPSGMMTPKEVKLRPTTPVEAEANAIWSIRAGLNIAALQCQYSTYLATVRNYNDFLRQHAEELDRARATMVAHFKRYDGAQAQTSFDRYTTQTYNSFSTLDAQYAFCDEAGRAGRTALTVRKGGLGRAAPLLRDQVRASLTAVTAADFLHAAELEAVALPQL